MRYWNNLRMMHFCGAYKRHFHSHKKQMPLKSVIKYKNISDIDFIINIFQPVQIAISLLSAQPFIRGEITKFWSYFLLRNFAPQLESLRLQATLTAVMFLLCRTLIHQNYSVRCRIQRIKFQNQSKACCGLKTVPTQIIAIIQSRFLSNKHTTQSAINLTTPNGSLHIRSDIYEFKVAIRIQINSSLPKMRGKLGCGRAKEYCTAHGIEHRRCRLNRCCNRYLFCNSFYLVIEAAI